MSAFGPFAIDMYLPGFPSIAAELDCSGGWVQMTLAVYLAGLALGQILWGTLSDSVGRRLPLLLGCLIFSGMSVLCALAPGIGTLIAARFFMALGGSAGVVIARAIVRDLFEEREAARFYSVMMMISGIAPIIAPFLGGLLLGQVGWRAIFWTITLFGFYCSAMAWRHVPETLMAERRLRINVAGVLGGYGRIAANCRFLGPALALGCTAGMLFTYIADSPFIFIELFGVPAPFFGFLFATNAIGMYLGNQSNNLLLRRFSPEWRLRKGMWFNVGASALLVISARTGIGGFPLLFATLFVCLSSLGVIFPNATAMTMQPFAREAGSASSLLGICQFILGALGGALVGVFQDGTALPMALQIACYAVLARFILLLTPRQSRH
jgi:DHA1 family bicyclomycin/chloramphenicol resistance-like MFS transporter